MTTVLAALMLLILGAMPALAFVPDYSVRTRSIVEGAVTIARLADGAVTTQKVKLNTLLNRNMANAIISNAKLIDNCITSEKIKDGTITNADIAPGAAIAASKIDTATLNADMVDGYHASAFILNSLPNPNQLALLRWYEAAHADTSFTVGNAPWGVAFDGANIWVANWGDDTVSKL